MDPRQAAHRPVAPFGEVASSNDFYPEVCRTTYSGLSGAWATFTGKLYRPYYAITRHYLAVFFYRLVGSPGSTSVKASPFTDVTTTPIFHKEICWLAEHGISAGCSNGDGTARSEPYWDVLRDQMATFFYRANTSSI